MKRYLITTKINMWATVEVEADSPEEATRIVNDPQFEEDWDYDIDYDSSKIESIVEITA